MKKVLLLIFFLLISVVSYADVMVIVNDSVPETTLTRQDIKDIFLGKKLFWNDKSKIIVATLSQGEANETFLNTYVNKSPKQYSSYLEKKVFTTPGSAPKRFTSSKKMMEYVSTTKGAIGYVDSKTKMKNVVPISID